MKRIKWFIANWLNRNPKYCWATLAMWAQGYYTTKETLQTMDEQMCRKSNHATPWAYCGKCEQTGRYYEKEKRTA